MNKPFLLIAGDEYYPCEGTGDWIGRFETYEEANKKVEQVFLGSRGGRDFFDYKIDGRSCSWYKIVNLETWMPDQ